MKKSVILLLYFVALYFVISTYYKRGNSGMPKPQVIAAPTYLYGILALTADFLEGFPIVLAAALTVALVWQATGNTQAQTTTKKVA